MENSLPKIGTNECKLIQIYQMSKTFADNNKTFFLNIFSPFPIHFSKRWLFYCFSLGQHILQPLSVLYSPMPFTTRSLCIVTPIFSPVVQLLYTVTFISFPFQPTTRIYISCLYLPFSSHLSLTTFFTFHASLIIRLALSLAVCRIHIVSLKWWLLFTLSSHLAPTTASLLTTQIKALNTQELFIPSPTNLPVILFLSSLPHILILCHCVTNILIS